MKNRWFNSANQIKALTYFCAALIGAGCVFATGAHAASLDSSIFGSGDVLIGATDLVWTASTNGINCPKPLPAGAEQVQGVYTENYIMQDGTYEAGTSLNNFEIIRQDTTRKVSMSDGMYREQAVYYAVGQSSNPLITCGNYIVAPSDLAATADNTTANSTPEATAYCEVTTAYNDFSGPLNYQSNINIQSLDITPDSFSIQAQASGNGRGTMTIAGYSLAGLTNTTTLGYQNSFHQTMTGVEKYQLAENFRWSSFSKTFDFPETTG